MRYRIRIDEFLRFDLATSLRYNVSHEDADASNGNGSYQD